tara:strand:- start:62 stop:322 length:261 start_codon:yes stop_codon:yes gene_type:complete
MYHLLFLKKSLIFFAGYPITFVLSGISLITPEPPPISTLFPIFRCPDIPACPPILTLLPIIELQAIPTWPAIIEFSPILTLCAICI